MSEEKLGRLEAAIKRICRDIVLHGERLNALEAKSKQLEKLSELDERVIAFARDVEAARRERVLSDVDFNENRKTLQDHEARLLQIEEGKK
jgi:hypothetical protein